MGLFSKNTPKPQSPLSNEKIDSADTHLVSDAERNSMETHHETPMEIDQDSIISGMTETGEITTGQPRQTATSKPRLDDHHLSAQEQEYQNAVAKIQKQDQELLHAHEKHHKAVSHIRKLERYIKGLQSDLARESNNGQNLEFERTELQKQLKDLKSKYDKKVNSYEELDKKYMDLASTLRVTDDDQSTITRKLTEMQTMIEILVKKGNGPNSVNLNRNAAVQHFSNSGLFQKFPVHEMDLQTFHLNLYAESAIMTILDARLFSRPLECIFDQGSEFQGICNWVEDGGSKAAVRWRQELCILIAQDSKYMTHRREKAVVQTINDLENLVSSLYQNVDLSDKIYELCNKAFDLSFAMLGMESRIYPARIALATSFNDMEMKMAWKSNPTGSVSLVIFPPFQDANRKFYFPAKVWCA